MNKLEGSWLENVPVVGYIQSKFDRESSQSWLEDHWYYSIIASFFYVVLVWTGRKWMSTRPPFDLRKPLILWNLGLAVFSMLGFVSIVPNLVYTVIKHGMDHAVCHETAMNDPQQAVWGFLFILSKIIEFGDTAFIVFRKSPLMLLHWYHHVTVCIYSWYGLGHTSSAVGDWFAAMNYTVHSLMYSYYAFKAAKFRVPSFIARIITILQITQMFGALYVNVMNYVLCQKLGNEVCECNEQVFKFGMIVYGSYAILFVKYFYDRYCSKKLRKD